MREAAEKRTSVADSDKFVSGGAAFLLGAFGSQQVTKTGRATHQLALGGQLEALSDGLLGLLHVRSGRKQRTARGLARGKCGNYQPFVEFMD